jgi:STE24 endopeptidase
VAITVLIIGAVLVLAAGYACGWLVRKRVGLIESSEDKVADKVHRLQRIALILFGAMFMLFIGGGALLGAMAAAARHGSGRTGAVLVGIAGLAVFAAGFVALLVGGRAVRRGVADVRGTSIRTPDRKRRVIGAVAMSAFWIALLVSGQALVPAHGTGAAIGRFLVYMVGLLLLTAVVVPLVVVRVSSRPLDEDRASRLRRLAERAHVSVRGYRVLKTRQQKIANAAQVGTLPGLRYVLLTDYLLDNLDYREVDAVVAHELGHARRHHVLIKLGAVFAMWVVLEGVAAAISAAAGHATGAILAAPLIVAIPVGMLVVQGLVGVRLERAADDQAAELVGADELAAALERVGELNDAKSDTGRGWALVTQHPGLQDRLARLRRAHRAPAHA